MYPSINNATQGFTLAEVSVPTVAELQLWYAPVRNLGPQAVQNMGFLNYPMTYAMRSVFGWETSNPYSGNHSCRYVDMLLSNVRQHAQAAQGDRGAGACCWDVSAGNGHVYRQPRPDSLLHGQRQRCSPAKRADVCLHDARASHGVLRHGSASPGQCERQYQPPAHVDDWL